jgi:hypothetical protein
LSIFNEEGVEYLLIGAYALAAHGNPRATKDIDLWVDCTKSNAERISRALSRFGAPSSSFDRTDFEQPGMTVQIGVPPRRIDVVTQISGLTFDDARPGRVIVEVEGLSIPIIGRDELLRNKRAAARPQDLADVAWLEENG